MLARLHEGGRRGFRMGGNQADLAPLGARQRQGDKPGGRRAADLHEDGRVCFFVHQHCIAGVCLDGRAVQPCRAAVGIAPDPEQVARRGREDQPAVAEAIAFHHHAQRAAVHVQQADAVPVIAGHVLGPGEEAIVRAVLVAGGAVVGVALRALGFGAQGVLLPLGRDAGEDAVRAARRQPGAVAPALR